MECFDGNKLAEVLYGPEGKLARNPVDNWAAVGWSPSVNLQKA